MVLPRPTARISHAAKLEFSSKDRSRKPGAGQLLGDVTLRPSQSVRIDRDSGAHWLCRFQQETIMSKTFQLALAPEKLWQAINPWTFYQQGAQFGFINIDLGQTPHPEVEQAILDEVGSYGRQLGRIGDALEVLLNHVKLDGLSQAEKDAVSVLRGQLAAVRQVKERTLRSVTPSGAT
jgi:hypothetical protein